MANPHNDQRGARRAHREKYVPRRALRALRCTSSSVCDVRNQRDLTRALERDLQLALMHRAGAGNPPRQDFPALRDERSQQLHVLVIDVVDLVRAELADLATAEHGTTLAVLLVAAFLVAAAAATAARSSLSEWHGLNLRSIKTVIVIVGVHRGPAAFAGLPLRRQPALDATPLRFALALGARAVDDLLLFV